MIAFIDLPYEYLLSKYIIRYLVSICEYSKSFIVMDSPIITEGNIKCKRAIELVITAPEYNAAIKNTCVKQLIIHAHVFTWLDIIFTIFASVTVPTVTASTVVIPT